MKVYCGCSLRFSYVIEGCLDHREYDRVRKLDVDVK